MKAQEIRTAAVLGAGTMGHGIAQVLAMSGIETRLYDVDAAAVERGLASVRANLDKGVEKGKVEAGARDAAVKRLSGTTRVDEAVAGVQCAIEAVPEKLELKQKIFADLGARLGADVLLATNTSSLPITRIASVTPHPARVVGMHFFNPVHIMKFGYGFPMGPLELTDHVGLDVRLSIAEYLFKELGDRFNPPALLRDKVKRGELGKKSGKGFYEWKG